MPVKLPERIDQITPDWNSMDRVPYPPLGFLSFGENSLGNGDCFGLYWPFGREHEEPLVAETLHDECGISPAFSSLDRFLMATGGSEEWVEEPTIEKDPGSPAACFNAAREMLRRNEVEQAVAHLLIATSTLPEFGEAQWILARQMFRLRRTTDAFAAVRAAILSPPCFGGASAEALGWLNRQNGCPDEFADDPLWQRKNELHFEFGGAKENQDYAVLRVLADEYASAGQGVLAMLILQTYGELMFQETESFQDRYGFSEESHLEAQLRLGREVGIDRRFRHDDSF